MKYSKLIFFSLSLPAFMQATIYQKIAADGKVYFSDTAMAGATVLKLLPINTYSPLLTQKQLSVASNQPMPVIHPYRLFSLLEPTQQQNFHNQREITATIQIAPALEATDKIQWWVDGKLHSQTVYAQTILANLDRGEHQLQAKLLNANDQILMSTALITFYIHYAVVPKEPKQ